MGKSFLVSVLMLAALFWAGHPEAEENLPQQELDPEWLKSHLLSDEEAYVKCLKHEVVKGRHSIQDLDIVGIYQDRKVAIVYAIVTLGDTKSESFCLPGERQHEKFRMVFLNDGRWLFDDFLSACSTCEG